MFYISFYFPLQLRKNYNLPFFNYLSYVLKFFYETKISFHTNHFNPIYYFLLNNHENKTYIRVPPKQTRIWRNAFKRYSLEPRLWPIHAQKKNAKNDVFCVSFSLLERENSEKFKKWALKRIVFKFQNKSLF
jgi:hypothetical protein